MQKYSRLKDIREDNDLDQNDIAKMLGTTQQQYSRWETGSSKIAVETMAKIAAFYNISLDYLAGLTDIPKTLNGDPYIPKTHKQNRNLTSFNTKKV